MRVCSYCHLVRTRSEAVCALGEEAHESELLEAPEALRASYGDLTPFAAGQTGSSYLATQTASRFRGLLKLIPLTGHDASDRMRLKRELRKQTKLTNNSLVRIIDGGETGPLLWLFRDHVEGESLALTIRRRGRIELPEALAIVAQVASALDELHRSGLLHRDVKPGHVLLQPRDEGVPIVKLIDAGIAGRLSTGSVFDMLGTPAYMSPEQIAGKLVSFRSDLYSLGCVLYEMLTGRPPFVADDVQSLLAAHKEQPAPQLAEDDAPGPVRTLLAALLEKEPRKRPFSAQQVRRTLEPFLPKSTPPAQSGTKTSAGNVRAPTRSQPAPPPRKPSYSRDEHTEEIDLDEIAMLEAEAEAGATSGGAFAKPRSTVSLTAADVEALAVVDEDDDASSFGGPRSTVNLSPEEVDQLAAEAELAERAPAPASGLSAPPPAGEAAAPESHPAEPAQSEPAALEDDAGDEDESENLETMVAASAAEGEGRDGRRDERDEAGTGEGGPAAAARPAVDFDVESLFDDEVAEPAQRSSATAASKLGDVAPTEIHRPEEAAPSGARDAPDEEKKTAIYQPGSRPPVRAPAEGDAEGTVMVARDAASGRKLPIPVLAAVGLTVAVLLWLTFSGDGDEAATAAETAEAESAPAPAAAADEAEPAPSPAADSPQGARAEDRQAEMAEGEAEPEADPGADPAEPAEEAEGAQAEGAGPEAAEGEQAAAGEPTDTPAAQADPDEGEREAGEAAAAELRRGDDPGGRVRSASGSRSDRVERAAQLKAEGLEHYKAGRYREAARAYAKAIQQTPSDAGAFAGLGGSQLAAGNAAAAIQAYQRALRLKPKSAGFHAALGRAYLARGDRARAKSAYERALQLDPNNGAAKAALARLK